MENEKRLVSKSSVDYLRDRLAETRRINSECGCTSGDTVGWANGIKYALKILGLEAKS